VDKCPIIVDNVGFRGLSARLTSPGWADSRPPPGSSPARCAPNARHDPDVRPDRCPARREELDARRRWSAARRGAGTAGLVDRRAGLGAVGVGTDAALQSGFQQAENPGRALVGIAVVLEHVTRHGQVVDDPRAAWIAERWVADDIVLVYGVLWNAQGGMFEAFDP